MSSRNPITLILMDQDDTILFESLNYTGYIPSHGDGILLSGRAYQVLNRLISFEGQASQPVVLTVKEYKSLIPKKSFSNPY